ncbi:MAG: hypothetical protein K6G88_11745 [Lachnospiraceae bacterium]|nr:hypothetical protein [Lachnospiraceae bacterium]
MKEYNIEENLEKRATKRAPIKNVVINCPVCNYDLCGQNEESRQNFCPTCGQALDWSGFDAVDGNDRKRYTAPVPPYYITNSINSRYIQNITNMICDCTNNDCNINVVKGSEEDLLDRSFMKFYLAAVFSLYDSERDFQYEYLIDEFRKEWCDENIEKNNVPMLIDNFKRLKNSWVLGFFAPIRHIYESGDSNIIESLHRRCFRRLVRYPYCFDNICTDNYPEISDSEAEKNGYPSCENKNKEKSSVFFGVRI